MKNTQSLGLFLIVLSAAAGCSKTVNHPAAVGGSGQTPTVPGQQQTAPNPQPSLTPTPTPTPSASVVASGAAAGKEIKAKYDSALLVCGLYFPVDSGNGQPRVKSLANDTVMWDLTKDFSNQKSFTLNVVNFRKDIAINFDIQSVVFEDTDKADNILALNGSYSYTSTTPIAFMRNKPTDSGQGTFSFQEASETVLADDYAGTSLENNSEEYDVFVDCRFETKLKSQSVAE